MDCGRSASIRIVRRPACARRCAKFDAMVDLPSSGKVDVKPITLFDFIMPLRSITTFSERSPSEKRDRGSSSTYCNRGCLFTIFRSTIAAPSLTILVEGAFVTLTMGSVAMQLVCKTSSIWLLVRKRDQRPHGSILQQYSHYAGDGRYGQNQ